jgi:hypothetical protein
MTPDEVKKIFGEPTVSSDELKKIFGEPSVSSSEGKNKDISMYLYHVDYSKVNAKSKELFIGGFMVAFQDGKAYFWNIVEEGKP